MAMPAAACCERRSWSGSTTTLSPRSVAGGLAYLSDSTSSSNKSTTARRSLDSLLGESCRYNARDCSRLRSSWEASSRVQDGCLGFERVPSIFSESRTSRTNNIDLLDKCCKNNELLSAVLPNADEAGLHRRISELRVALEASERARKEGDSETSALRAYLASVEAGASTLHLRVQELEREIQLLRSEEKDLEQLRGNMLAEASKEAESQAAAAAQAVAAGREATMELDRARRHYSAVVKSQEEEISRLCKEVENSRMLYQARAAQADSLKEQIQRLEKMKLQAESDTPETKKKLESLQLALKRKEEECVQLKDGLELANNKATALNRMLRQLESEKEDVKVQNEWLEQQVNELQNRQVMATIAHYDCELRKVRAALGGEKAHLLSELAHLRCRNKSLRGNLAEWQEKYKVLSSHVSGLECVTAANAAANTKLVNPLREDVRRATGAGKKGDAVESPPSPADVEADAVTIDVRKNKSNKSSKNTDSQGESNGPVKKCKTQCCMCGERDSILAAAHREIMKLNQINEWLVAACRNDVNVTMNEKNGAGAGAGEGVASCE